VLNMDLKKDKILKFVPKFRNELVNICLLIEPELTIN